MASLSKTFAIIAALGSAACAPAAATRGGEGEAPRNVVFMIADGAGLSYWSAAAHARESPAFARMPVVALVGTRSANRRVPDSSATASSLSIGEPVTNRVVSMVGCPQPEPRQTSREIPAGCEPGVSWFDIARARGKAVGAVTTTRIVDASPAAFVARSPSRYWYDEIAEQFARADLAVMLGGGRDYFSAASRADGVDLLGPLCADAVCVSTAAELQAYRPDDRPLVGLFAPDDMGAAGERRASLPRMTDAALARLSRDPDGFVVIVESEGTDNAGHANDPLSVITAEMLEFDDAIARALAFADANPGTLVIATADHETGGFALNDAPGAAEITGAYTTTGHTASMVPLFAYGAGAERLAGVHSNVEIGRILKAMLSSR